MTQFHMAECPLLSLSSLFSLLWHSTMWHVSIFTIIAEALHRLSIFDYNTNKSLCLPLQKIKKNFVCVYLHRVTVIFFTSINKINVVNAKKYVKITKKKPLINGRIEFTVRCGYSSKNRFASVIIRIWRKLFAHFLSFYAFFIFQNEPILCHLLKWTKRSSCFHCIKKQQGYGQFIVYVHWS